jgi:hypothetical protein
MTFKPSLRSTRWLLAAGLAAGVATAYAANPFNISVEQEALITPGMSASEVEQAIGRPEHVAVYVNQDGPSWTYNVASGSWRDGMAFEVDFGADGRVVSSEQLVTDDNR